MTRSLVAMAALTVAVVIADPALPTAASPGQTPSRGPVNQGLRTSSDGDSAGAEVWFDPAAAPAPAGEADDLVDRPGGRRQGPVCWYEPLRYTTQQEQRTEIRPEEQRPGQWGWRVCDDGTQRFQFFADAPDAPAPDPVDPLALADSVVLTPRVPTILTSPPAGTLHLVNLESWFWIDPADWGPASEPASAGPVNVTVTATPVTLVVDPGDGSPPLRCASGGTAYDTDLPAEAQRSDCTHTYTEAGTYTATATVVYDVSWTSNIGPGGDLADITPPGEPFELEVAEGQAVVVSGTAGGSGSGSSRSGDGGSSRSR